MNEAIIIVCALVWAVAATVGGVWIMLHSRAATLKLSVDLATLRLDIEARTRALTDQIDRTSNSKLAAEVEDLRAAFAVSRAGVRKELGSLWGRIGHRASGAILDGQTGLPLEGDDEVAAMLALQRATHAGPGNGAP